MFEGVEGGARIYLCIVACIKLILLSDLYGLV